MTVKEIAPGRVIKTYGEPKMVERAKEHIPLEYSKAMRAELELERKLNKKVVEYE